MKKIPRKKSKWPLYISITLVGLLILGYFMVPSVNTFINEAWDVLTSNDEEKYGFG